VCCSVLQCVSVCCSKMLQYAAVCCSVLQYAAVCCSMLQCFWPQSRVFHTAFLASAAITRTCANPYHTKRTKNLRHRTLDNPHNRHPFHINTPHLTRTPYHHTAYASHLDAPHSTRTSQPHLTRTHDDTPRLCRTAC